MDIEKYIEASKSMPNTSDGGSDAYHFDDVVLVKYIGTLKYGGARKDEEQVAVEANKKRAQGVRTPAHLAIKREVDSDIEICWVLEERAKGKSFNSYCYNKEPNVQIEAQRKIANAPISHYEKFISDVCELFNLGLELKPKNMFYDESLTDGGFTIIDLLGINGEPFNHDSIKDIIHLETMIQGVYNCSRISSLSKATPEEYATSTELYYQIRQKMFIAMEHVIPNFNQHRCTVLRSMPFEVLNYFNSHGTTVGNLSLDEEEIREFNIKVNQLIDNNIEKVSSGEYNAWQILANEIRIELETSGLNSSWMYHNANSINPNQFDGPYAYYDYKKASSEYLKEIVTKSFLEKFYVIAEVSNNEYIKKAKAFFDARGISTLKLGAG